MSHEFWLSEGAAGYPDHIVINGSDKILINGSIERMLIGGELMAENLIPLYGEILDVGAASCSGLIYGKKDAASRVTAVDISPVLLARNPVPVERKQILNVGLDFFPKEWRYRFALASAIFLNRYLTDEEALHMATEVRSVLAYGASFVIVDQHNLESPDLIDHLGEARVFDPEYETEIVLRAGFSAVSLKDLQILRFEEGEFIGPTITALVAYNF